MGYDEKRPTRNLVLIGGSSGSLAPLRTILSTLSADFPATILCVQHLLARGHSAAETLRGSLAIRALPGEDQAPFEPGVAYFAPPDRHLLLDGEVLRVVRGPRENNVRPSIDVLFRSAAVAARSRIVAVLLSGTQSDGVLGISAVKRCGGVTIVQDPKDAASPELPTRALQENKVDHICQSAEIGQLLATLCESEAPAAPTVPHDLLIEARAAAAAMAPPEELGLDVARPMHVTCPECDGPIWRLNSPGPADFRCEVGHGFTTEALLQGQSRSLERALWVAFRTLKERGILIDDLAKNARNRGYEASARSFDLRREEVELHAAAIHEVLTSGWAEAPEELTMPSSGESDGPSGADAGDPERGAARS